MYVEGQAIKNFPDPIIFGNELLRIYLKVNKSECTLQYYDPVNGEPTDKLVKGTHWQLLHEDIPPNYVNAVYDCFTDYYYVQYNLCYTDLTKIAKYAVRDHEVIKSLMRTHIAYTYQ